MNIIVIGAGIIGLTTARALLADGHDVTVLDEAAQAGVGTSKANGAQLSYSFVAPLADPSVLGKLPGWLTRRDAPLRLRLRADPAQWRWALKFPGGLPPRHRARATAELLQLGLHSRRLTRALVQDGALSCDFSASVRLLVYQDAAAFAGARANALPGQPGLRAARAGTRRMPGAGARAGRYRPARGRQRLHASEDAADCQALCASLARGLGARLRLGTRVRRLRLRGGAVQALETSAGEMQADAYVVANGVGAQALCRQAGLQPLIYPLKGYSLTYALGPDSSAPRTSLSDVHNKVVYARLGDRLRVAGMVDIGDRDAGIDGGRIHQLKEQVRRYLPRLAPAGEPEAWAGLRPARRWQAADRPTPVRGLWINAGHGALGFTLAAGSAGVLADRIAGRPSPISDTLFQW